MINFAKYYHLKTQSKNKIVLLDVILIIKWINWIQKLLRIILIIKSFVLKDNEVMEIINNNNVEVLLLGVLRFMTEQLLL